MKTRSSRKTKGGKRGANGIGWIFPCPSRKTKAAATFLWNGLPDWPESAQGSSPALMGAKQTFPGSPRGAVPSPS